MKVKRLLSAFMAVAIVLTTIVTLSTVSFAEEIKPKLTVTVDPVDGKENTWVLTAKLSNYGELKRDGDSKRILGYWSIYLNFPEGILKRTRDYPTTNGIAYSGDEQETIYTAPVGKYESETVLSLMYNSTMATDAYYPGEFDALTNVSEEILLGTMQFTTNKDTFEIKLEANVKFGPVDANGFINTNAEPLYEIYPAGSNNAQLDAPKTISVPATKTYTVKFYDANDAVIGEAQTVEEGQAATAPEAPTKASWEDDEYTYTYTFEGWSVDFSAVTSDLDVKPEFTETKTAKEKAPVIESNEAVAADGVAITGSDAKYDNAFATKASFSNAGAITAAGVLFIPKAVLGDAALTVDTATVAKAETTKAALGDGTLTIVAAIKAIPRALQGTDIIMVTMPYILKGGAYTYGEKAETKINFGDTGEVK